MIGLAGLLSVAAGGAIAYLSPRFPAHIEMLETATGLLLIAGFALAGCGLPTLL
jgi:hypothetical protein